MATRRTLKRLKPSPVSQRPEWPRDYLICKRPEPAAPDPNATPGASAASHDPDRAAPKPTRRSP